MSPVIRFLVVVSLTLTTMMFTASFVRAILPPDMFISILYYITINHAVAIYERRKERKDKISEDGHKG